MTIVRQSFVAIEGMLLTSYTASVVSSPVPMLIILFAAGYVMAWYDWQERDKKHDRMLELREPIRTHT